MDKNEKIIRRSVGVFMLIFSLAFIIIEEINGHTSFWLYLIPFIFITFSLFLIFEEQALKFFKNLLTSRIFLKPKIWIEVHSNFVFFILPLSFFAIIGFVALFFAIKYPTNLDAVGWITILLFATLPIILIYFFVFGISISEKRQQEIADRLDSLSATEKGISIERTIFDKTCFASWSSIDAITYYNFYVSSDFTEYYEGYKLYLNTIPVYTKYKKQWWLNRLFPKDSPSKIVDIKVGTKHFSEIPKMVENYLNTKTAIDFNNPLKGTLISVKTFDTKSKTTTIEKWKPNNIEPEQIVFNRLNRTIEEIKKNYR